MLRLSRRESAALKAGLGAREGLRLVPIGNAARYIFRRCFLQMVFAKQKLQILLTVLAAILERDDVVAIDLVALKVHDASASAGA